MVSATDGDGGLGFGLGLGLERLAELGLRLRLMSGWG